MATIYGRLARLVWHMLLFAYEMNTRSTGTPCYETEFELPRQSRGSCNPAASEALSSIKM